jgi:hypothetical protein
MCASSPPLPDRVVVVMTSLTAAEADEYAQLVDRLELYQRTWFNEPIEPQITYVRGDPPLLAQLRRIAMGRPVSTKRRPVDRARARLACIVGAANTSRQYETPSEMAGHLRRTARMDPDLSLLTDDPRFDELAISRAWSLFGLRP